MRSMSNNNLNYKYWYLDSSGVLRPLSNNDIITTGIVDGSNIIDGVNLETITVSATPPVSPTLNDLWVDTAGNNDLDIDDGDFTTTGTGTFGDLVVNGTIDAAGDISASTNGSSTTTPRVFGYKDLTSGEAARFQFGDKHNGLQNAYAKDCTLYSYWGLVLAGGMQNYSSGFEPPAFTKTTDVGVLVLSTNDIGDDPGEGATNIVTMAIKAVASQTNDLTQWRASNDSVLASVSSTGDITGATLNADNGFTGTGAYTNFTIVNGIITAAS